MFRNIYGLDLGTYEVKIYNKRKDKIVKEKNVIAMRDRKHVFSVGDDAYEMYEKAPENIHVVFPMNNGVIAHFNDMQYLLQYLLAKEPQGIGRANYVVAVPTDVTEVEKRAFYDLVFHSAAKAKSVQIVERGIADAIGLGLDIRSEQGIFIANFGGGTTELSVISSGGMVMNRLIQIGGMHFDEAIVNRVRHNRDFLIGRLTAENLCRRFGVFDEAADAELTVAGRSLINGVPQQKSIPIGIVRASIKEQLEECVRAIRSMIERTPPDVRRGILSTGIYITGGLANLKGLTTYLEETLHLPVITKQDPELCAVSGLRKIISDKNYRNLTYSMLDEDYRWLR
ncbi:MAG: rod shape-determining protein [Candidatus Ruminococcus intestinipullorum]|nr:rod shape-determining protein [Candidatus Ruminococcus intestinipullorum]